MTMRFPMKSTARVADSIHFGSSSTRPALAMPRIAMPFHAVSILSSLPGAMRFATRVEQFAARACQQRVRFFTGDRQAFDHGMPGVAAMQIPLTFEISGLVEAVQRFDDEVFVGREQPFDLVAAPDVELAFFAFGIRVDGAEVTAVWMLHLAHQPRGGFSHGAVEQRIGTDRERVGIHAQQRAVVVQHLFEVRNHPARIGRVAAETAADVIVDAAARDVRQRDHRHLERVAVFFRCVASGECPVAQQPFDRRRHREFRCRAETAFACIVLAGELIAREL